MHTSRKVHGLSAVSAAMLVSLSGCGATAPRPITDAADVGKTCQQLSQEADQLALQSVRRAADVRAMKVRERTFTILSYVPVVGGFAGMADLVGDASGSRADAEAAEDRDWSSARGAYLREVAASQCSQNAPAGSDLVAAFDFEKKPSAK